MFTAEQLIGAIREADTLKELKQMVGPTAAENEAARVRLERIDAIYNRCNKRYQYMARWPEVDRANHDQLNREQDAFEADYA